MKTEIKTCLDTLRFGESQFYRHISVIPLHGAANGAPPYIALADAMNAKTITVTEISEGGSVPELLVNNESAVPVLIIDGEELLGANQNRILNTTILLKEKSRTKVPVSCTEAGRWATVSAQFMESDAMLAHKIRSSKSRSVQRSLSSVGKHYSDQNEVWEGISKLQAKAESDSPTAAMHDTFEAQQGQLDDCLRAFLRQEGQVGVIVIIAGRVAGLDLVSRPEVYARLHDKLIRSYVLDALLDKPEDSKPNADPIAMVRQFITAAEDAKEEVFDSVSYGKDYRYTQSELTGSALVHDGKLIHAAFLSIDEKEGADDVMHLASLRHRRRYRTESE
jgi:hypothetical protein